MNMRDICRGLVDLGFGMIYYGPHIHAALICLRAGNREGAASWMARDIGERDDDPSWYPDPDSLSETTVGYDDQPAISYVPLRNSWVVS